MNTILNSLSPSEKLNSFVTIYKDGAEFDIKISDFIGAPASFNMLLLYESGVIYEFGIGSYNNINVVSSSNLVVNILGLGDPSKYKLINMSGRGIAQIKNANLLTNLQDEGTSKSLNLSSNSLSAIEINSLFAQLPLTTKTATIDVSANTGSATCTPSIATSKGYTVVTS
jgi:hypothetical protein